MIVENHATFSISSTVRTAAQIAEALGLAATESHEAGDPRFRPDGSPVQHPPFHWATAVWFLEADNDGSGDDRSGAASLAEVLELLRGRMTELDQLREDCHFEISWWGDSPSSQGGFVLSEDLLGVLAQLRCPLYLTAYTTEDARSSA